MTIEIVEGCLLKAFEKGEVNIIGHCCNAKGVMGSGIAKSIRTRYPQAYQRYRQLYELGELKTGNIIGANIGLESDNKIIFNLVGQESYGYDGKKYLDDEGFKKCLGLMSCRVKPDDVVGFPLLMGCDRAGGHWPSVVNWIDSYFTDNKVKIYKLEK
jgi:O-acetyl-ADP-ribose deacetylase (regulator of RNase III)